MHSRAKCCHLIGYAQLGYIVYEATSHKIWVARNIKFMLDERKTVNMDEQQQEHNRDMESNSENNSENNSEMIAKTIKSIDQTILV